jgi:Tfp pilus assembly protein PilV
MLIESNKQTGLTIIGVLIALFILSTASLSTAGLISRNKNFSGLAREQFIATGLAREGLELVHAQRDTNWFLADQTDHWMAELCGESFETSRQILVDHDQVESVFITDNTANSQLFITADNHYTHIQSTGQPSSYSRLITIDCSQRDVADHVTEDSFVIVDATVTWTSRGQDRTVSLKTKLYDWFRPAE